MNSTTGFLIGVAAGWLLGNFWFGLILGIGCAIWIEVEASKK